MTVNEDRATQSEATNQSAVARYTFQQLLERRVEKLGLDLVFHIHVPKASGGTVNVLFRQNNFFVLDFDMSYSRLFRRIFPSINFWKRTERHPRDNHIC